MAAKLGMDLQPVQRTEEEKTFSKNAIETYKQIRNTVLFGDLYRILSPYKSNRTVFMYASEDKNEAIVFNFLVRKEIKPNMQTVYLQGLDPNKKYTLKEINKIANWSRSSAYEGKEFSGDYLMTVGLTFPMYNEYESVVLQLNSVR
jgi:alpha-galactosidase